MILTRTVEPAVEPVTLEALKAHLRITAEDAAEDDLLSGYLAAARDWCEMESRRSFVTQTWKLVLDAWPPRRYITLLRPPTQGVTSVTYYDPNHASAVMSASTAYWVDTNSEPGRIMLRTNVSWPSVVRDYAAIEVVYVAGYGVQAAQPAWVRQAVLLLAGHYYENREATLIAPGAMPGQSTIPYGVSALCMANRAY